jgi:hypothetical protein
MRPNENPNKIKSPGLSENQSLRRRTSNRHPKRKAIPPNEKAESNRPGIRAGTTVPRPTPAPPLPKAIDALGMIMARIERKVQAKTERNSSLSIRSLVRIFLPLYIISPVRKIDPQALRASDGTRAIATSNPSLCYGLVNFSHADIIIIPLRGPNRMWRNVSNMDLEVGTLQTCRHKKLQSLRGPNRMGERGA